MDNLSLNLLKSLISIPSPSGNESKLAKHILKKFKSWGLNAKMHGPNVVLYLKGENSKKAVIINSHLDTVGPGNKKWKFGAFEPVMVGKKLYGLGASDMKAGIAASMMLAKGHKIKPPPVDIWFTYVVMEEIDGSGTDMFSQWFEKRGYYKKYHEVAAIFTEPTSMNEIEHGHRGNLFIRATSKGKSGHSSRPIPAKDHAVRNMMKFADVFQKEVVKWNKRYKSKYFSPSITLGEMTSIRAGISIKKNSRQCEVIPESPNKFPSLCITTFDIRTIHDFHQIAYGKIKKLAKKYDVKVELEHADAPAGFTDEKDNLIVVAKKHLPKAKLSTSQGSADLGFLSVKGAKSIILGPGEKLQSHKVNEYCYPHQIPQAVDIYQKIISDWSK